MTIVANDSITVSNVNDGSITHTAWSYSADGSDRFTTVYPNLNLFTGTSDKPSTKTGNNWNVADIGVYKAPKVGQKYTVSVELPNADHTVNIEVFRWNNAGGRVDVLTSKRINSGEKGYVTFTWPDPGNSGSTQIAANLAWINGTDTGTYSYCKAKLEFGNTATPYMLSASEVTTADWPKYIGHYTDFMQADSTNPSDYTWGPMRGDDGVGVTSTVITYANSTSGTMAPSTGWTSSIPSPVKGQYLWTKTVWTSTDTSSKTAYSVSYNSKDGTNGTDGTSGIIVSSVSPDSPQTGQLWQDTSTTPQLVKKWTGSEWVIWELYAQNLKADTLETVAAKIGKIYNEFDNSSGGMDNKGTITIEDSVKVVYYLGNSSTTIDLVASSSGQGLFTQHLPDKTDTSKFKQSWYMPTGLYFTDSINNWTGQITAENVTLVPWTNLTYLSGYTTAENNPCQYRKIKNLDGSYTVQFRGQVKPVSGSFPGTNSESNFKIIANLPADIRPSRHTFLSAIGDMMGTQTIRIGALSDGRIQVGVRGTASSYIGINSLEYTI